MYVDGISEAQTLANLVSDTLRRFDIPATPNNYALWYEYHAGHNPDLQRTIDVIISNKGDFDERTLEDLYKSFFSSVREAQTVRETSRRALEALHDFIALADGARADARLFGAALSSVASGDLGRSMDDLKDLIEHLVHESHKMAGRNEYAGVRMRESADKIETLERNLESALRDATLDGLTGVANRKSFDALLRKMAGDCMNTGEDLALLMIDIDHFKVVNDTWGHPVGDAVLRHLAKTLQQSVRGEDYVARYGGEEFAILLPRANARAAVMVGENIRQALSRERLTLDIVPPMRAITVSIGVSCYEPGDLLAEWIGRSDAALYRAKNEGRNRVHSA